MIFVLGEVALGQGFLRVLRFSPLSTILPTLDIHLQLHAILTSRTNGESRGTFQQTAKVKFSRYRPEQALGNPEG